MISIKMFIRTIILHAVIFFLGFTAVLADTSESPEDLVCPDGWLGIHRGCYMFITEEKNWDDALADCKDKSGELSSILSFKEMEEMSKYLVANPTETGKWWVALQRDSTTGQDWRWLDANHTFSPLIMPWKDPAQVSRPGKMCGMVDISNPPKLYAAITRCTVEQPYICEYHSITPRPEILLVADASTATTESPTQPPLPQQPVDMCPCRDSSEVRSSDSIESPENRLRRRNQGLNVDEELYQRYLQSEIDANNAKVVYYSEVKKLYQEALEAQNQYYNKHQTKLDLEINQLREGPKCT